MADRLESISDIATQLEASHLVETAMLKTIKDLGEEMANANTERDTRYRLFGRLLGCVHEIDSQRALSRIRQIRALADGAEGDE